ncbi:MAG: hypothetical protein ACP5VQ_05375 [Phycisphaerae bacterium]
MGVVFLFSHLARRLRIRIEKIGSSFPDCIAYQKTGGLEKRMRIEFEYKSGNFRAHHHSARGCDCIVCWEHDWPGVPQRVRVIELRKFFGLGFNVWIQPVIRSQWPHLKLNRLQWGLSKRAHHGDLLLMYRCHPDQRIEDIFIVRSDLRPGKADWRKGKCYGAEIKRVCMLASPVFLKDIRLHPVLRTSSFVRRNMQGNLHVTEYWPYLYQTIVARNPACRKQIKVFAPERTLG